MGPVISKEHKAKMKRYRSRGGTGRNRVDGRGYKVEGFENGYFVRRYAV